MTVKIDNINHVFETKAGQIPALRDVSASIADGEFVSVVGPSGCGKSTLLRIVAGLIKPTEGTVSFDGKPVEGPLADAGFVFQKPVLFPWRTVLDNVMFPYQMRAQQDGSLRAQRSKYQQRARDLLDLVGLDGFEKAYPRELSGGMAQRASICRALLLDPAVLLMDEPFGALDEFSRDRLNVELLRIWQETRKTVFFVTHHIPEAVFLSDRVIALSPRPGEVLGDLTIQLSRPRSPDVREAVPFLEETVRVRKHLRFDEPVSQAG
jgi:NitT/TauT family transport system ATP-binding protein